MHYIQQHILDKLVYAEFLRNRDMRPPHVESNLYQYHLLQLQKDGYIRKQDKTYTLTSNGLAYADTHSTTLKKARPQPKVVTVLFITNSQGQILIRTKQRQPFIGQLGLIFGKMHKNETIHEAASREFVEKVNDRVDGLHFKQCGVAHFVITSGETVVSDYIGILLTATISDDTVIKPFAQFYDPDNLPKDKLSPSTAELLTAFQEQQQFLEHTIAT